MTTLINRWRCDACLKEHGSLEEARACEARGVEGDLGVKVGEHVTCNWNGWWNGENKNWRIYKPGNPRSKDHFERLPHYHCVWRVVHIGTKGPAEHMLGYLLWTPCGEMNKPLFACTGEHHIEMLKVAAPLDAAEHPTPDSFDGKDVATDPHWWRRFPLT